MRMRLLLRVVCVALFDAAMRLTAGELLMRLRRQLVRMEVLLMHRILTLVAVRRFGVSMQVLWRALEQRELPMRVVQMLLVFLLQQMLLMLVLEEQVRVLKEVRALLAVAELRIAVEC